VHIPDGFLDTKTIIVTNLISGTALYVAFRRLNRAVSPEKVPLMGVLASFAFAAQLLAFPVAAGTSAHITGAVLLAVILGPFTSLVLIAMILLLQALLFQHGGVLTLGANLINLGLAGSLFGYVVYRIREDFLMAGVAAFLAMVAGGVCAAAELTISGRLPWKAAVISIGTAQVGTGLVEGFVTVSVLTVIQHVRPDLLELRKI